MHRLSTAAILAILVGCAPAPPPTTAPKPDVTTEAWYAETAAQLAAMSREAEALVKKGDFEQAGAIITKGQPLQNRLLSAERPTLAALEAVSDLDDVYGRMLLRNHHYVPARNLFQKNVIRWKVWKPPTPATLDRWKTAVAAVAECDRHMAE